MYKVERLRPSAIIHKTLSTLMDGEPSCEGGHWFSQAPCPDSGSPAAAISLLHAGTLLLAAPAKLLYEPWSNSHYICQLFESLLHYAAITTGAIPIVVY